ncbi:MAG TPA: hypothetical protein P5228_04190 [Bacteroidales bacterium]|nr:hypothetical protein [Bacteroidales bacterium]HRZ49666.1 hypothetical protein [Bacteroidales bacterium]
MSIRTFWSIFLKIFGIWLILESFSVIPQFFSVFAGIVQYPDQRIYSFLALLGFVVLTTLVYIALIIGFVFRNGWIIDKLKLDQGYAEEKLDFNFSAHSVLRTVIIIIGALMVVESLPMFLKQLYYYYQGKHIFQHEPTVDWIIFYFLKGVIGYLIVSYNRGIARFIEKQTKSDDNHGKSDQIDI